MKRLPDRYRLLIRLLLVSIYLLASIGSEAHRAWHDHFGNGTTCSLSVSAGSTHLAISNDSGHDASTDALGSSCLVCAHSMGIPLVPVVLVEAVVTVRQPHLTLPDSGIFTPSVALLPSLRAPPFRS